MLLKNFRAIIHKYFSFVLILKKIKISILFNTKTFLDEIHWLSKK